MSAPKPQDLRLQTKARQGMRMCLRELEGICVTVGYWRDSGVGILKSDSLMSWVFRDKEGFCTYEEGCSRWARCKWDEEVDSSHEMYVTSFSD